MAFPRFRRSEPAYAALPVYRVKKDAKGKVVRDQKGKPVKEFVKTITAAAQVLSGPRIDRTTVPTTTKKHRRVEQREAWTYYDQIGELHSAITWKANTVSRARLIAALPGEGGDEPEQIEDGPVAALVAGLAGGPAEQAALLGRLAAQLDTPGEGYIVAEPAAQAGDPDLWNSFSGEEITCSAGRWSVDEGDGARPIAPDALIIRCWRAHPMRKQWPDSGVLAALPVLRELAGLTAHIDAQITSRLAGAGLLLVPNEITVPTGQAAQGGDDDEGEDDFVKQLIDTMTVPIKDRGSAAAVVPMVAKVPAETIGKFQHLTFGGALDSQAKDMREEAIRRLALGADMPPEIMLGLGATNHWSAWQVGEDAIQAYIAPLVALICHALTTGWLRPAMEELAVPDAGKALLWYDLSELTVRPDKSGNAQVLYGKTAISAAALRRENGFDESDAPTADEARRGLITELVVGAPTLAPVLLPLIGIDIGSGADSVAPAGADTSTAAPITPPPGTPRALPNTQPQAGTQPPALAASAGPALGYVAELAVRQALAHAGKRMLTREMRGRYRDVPHEELYQRVTVGPTDCDRLLAGAWDQLTAAVPGCPALGPRLDVYVRALLCSGQEHDPLALAAVLTGVSTGAA